MREKTRARHTKTAGRTTWCGGGGHALEGSSNAKLGGYITISIKKVPDRPENGWSETPVR